MADNAIRPDKFTQSLLAWHALHGRKNLPWQIERTPYRVWISEIMLQQTQVKTVIPYYLRFMESFDSINALANVHLDDLLALWQGLGYYSRARNLHKTAGIISQQFDGVFPKKMETLITLPGIGRSTAGAIMSLAFNQAHAILDGNAKRVLSRYHAISSQPNTSKTDKQLWALAESHLPDASFAQYTQAIMDLGSGVCLRVQPKCTTCPVQSSCAAHQQGQATQYPAPKIKKAKPNKQRWGLVVTDAQSRLALIKRSNTGIWPGLWSFPEFGDRQQLLSYLMPQYAKTLQRNEQIQKHVFSHYTLDLHIASVTSKHVLWDQLFSSHTLQWYSARDAFHGGITKAVLQYLHG